MNRKRIAPAPDAPQKRTPPKRRAAETPLAAMKRKICNVLKVWRTCGNHTCRRAHDCRRDPEACFARRWQVEPEDSKVWFQEFVKARLRGLGVRDALKAAAEEHARFMEWEARPDPQAAQSGAIARPTVQEARPAAPLLRNL